MKPNTVYGDTRSWLFSMSYICYLDLFFIILFYFLCVRVIIDQYVWMMVCVCVCVCIM